MLETCGISQNSLAVALEIDRDDLVRQRVTRPVKDALPNSKIVHSVVLNGCRRFEAVMLPDPIEVADQELASYFYLLSTLPNL